MSENYVTRAEFAVLIEFVAPRGEPNACDGPSSLVRGRREWLDRALAEARGPVDDIAIRTEPASVHEGVFTMVTCLGCGLPVSNGICSPEPHVFHLRAEHCVAALRAELAAERARSDALVETVRDLLNSTVSEESGCEEMVFAAINEIDAARGNASART